MKKVLLSFLKRVSKILSGKGLAKIPGVMTLYYFIYKIAKPKNVVLINVLGNKMYVNCKDLGVTSDLLVKGYYEEHETKIFKELVKAGMNIIDIGANIGYYTLIAAKLVGESGRVYAFEPDLTNYELLVKNIKINGYANVFPFQKAVSNKNGKAKFFIAEDSFGNHSFSKSNISEKAKFTEVRTIALDDFFENTIKDTKIDFIKMDIQGAEGLAIEGMKNILRNNNVKIFMEFWLKGLKNCGTDPMKLLKDLQECGFRIRMIGKEEHQPEIMEISEIIELSQDAEKRKKTINLLLEKASDIRV